MWISILGAEGTCKQEIANWLHKEERFRIAVDSYKPEDHEDYYYNQIRFLFARWDDQYNDLQKNMNEQDIVQVRSFWDTHQVYNQALIHSEFISKGDYNLLELMYKKLEPTLLPPHIVFYCHTNSMDALTRMKMKNNEIHHSEFFGFNQTLLRGIF